MPKGSCDPSPAAFCEQTLAKGDGHIIFDIRYSWDGVSVWPACAGPIHDVRLRNTGAVAWFAHIPRARGGSRAVAIDPGVDRVLTGAQLTAVGLETIADIGDLTITAT